MKYRTVEEVKMNIEAQDFVLVDVREADELAEWSIKTALHIPLSQIEDRAQELPKDQEISLMCAIGPRAQKAAKILKSKGFTNLSIVKGGAREYRSKIK